MKKMILTALTLTTLLSIVSPVFAEAEGPGSTGGGDHFTNDFINVAESEVYPWLVSHGQNLATPVDAEVFKKHINPKRIASADVVYESCWSKNKGLPSGIDRMVVACYNAERNMIYINRRLYPIDLKNSPSKRSLVMHEIFRKMGLEGDNYEITRNVFVALTEPFKMLSCMRQLNVNANFSSSSEKNLAQEVCEKTGADETINKCIVDLYINANFSSFDEKKLATKNCLKTNADAQIKSCIINLYTKANMSSYDEKILAISNCTRTGGSVEIQQCIIDLYNNANFSSFDEKKLATKACQRVQGNPEFTKFIKQAYYELNMTSYDEKLQAIQIFIRGFQP